MGLHKGGGVVTVGPKVAYARDGNVYGMHIQCVSDLAYAAYCHICDDAARHVCK